MFTSAARVLSLAMGALCLARMQAQDKLPAPTIEFAPESHGIVTVPVRNGLDMSVSINGNPDIDVEFDSGAGGALLSTNLAKRLGLKLEGYSESSGFGSGSRHGTVAKADTFRIGDLTLHDLYFLVFDPPMAGADEFALIGTPLMEQLLVKVEYDKQRITFAQPDRLKVSDRSKPIALQLGVRGLVCAGSVDGLPGTISIDTGDAWSLEILSRFVTEHDLVARYDAKFQGFAGSGLGGDDTAFYTRIHTLRIGDEEVHEPFALLFTDTWGGGATSTNMANVGTRVLSQFTLTIDVPHGKMYLERNAGYGKPDIFNRAGLVLDGDHDALVVKTVLPGSPGAGAGFREGDRIVQVNGRSTAQPTNTAALSEPLGLDLFRQPVGTTLHIKLRRGHALHTVTLRLKEII